MQARLEDIKTIRDARGALGVIEGADLPFDIQRVYFLYGVAPNAMRGAHGHIALEQFIFCVQGSAKLTLDDGATRTDYDLSSAASGVYVPPMHWREISDFSADGAVIVLASQPYTPEDYIFDYDAFVRMARGGDADDPAS